MIAPNNRRSARSGGNGNTLLELIGDDQCMRDLRSRITSMGAHDCTVLISGESGTGKELVARHIHAASPRAADPFVIADCTALPDGLFESQLFGHVKGAFTGADHSTLGLFRAADGETLFIDEIGELKPHMQAKLLRCIQERSVLPVGAVEPIQADVRIIAATHRDLKEMVAGGQFREDLYYRLDVVRVNVPTLRLRRGDIPQLARHFLREMATRDNVTKKAFSVKAMAALEGYSWPGNVRELRNAIDRVAVLSTSEQLSVADLPEAVRNASEDPGSDDLFLHDKVQPLHVVERCVLEQALRATNGNQCHAARLLQVERHRLSRMISRHGLRTLMNSLRFAAGTGS